MPEPKITVGMTCYRKEDFVGEAIQSVLDQTFTDFELVISDDCSPDSSAEVCQSYADKDSRIRFFPQKKNLGMIDNFNFVLNEARGEYFMWFSSDDRIDPNWLETCLAGLRPETAISFGRIVDVGFDGAVTKTYPVRSLKGSAFSRVTYLYWRMLQECNLLHGLTRTEVVRSRGGLGRFRPAGYYFDFLYVFESANRGELVMSEAATLYRGTPKTTGSWLARPSAV